MHRPSLPKHHLFVMNIDWYLFSSSSNWLITNIAESVRIELTWVLSQPWLSKPVQYRSANSPFFTHRIARSSLHGVPGFFCVTLRNNSFTSAVLSRFRRERDSNSWGFLNPVCFSTGLCEQDRSHDHPDSLLRWRTHNCGWRKIWTFNHRLNKPLLCRWAIHPLRSPAGTRTQNPLVKSQVHLPIELRDHCLNHDFERLNGLIGFS